MTAEWALTYDQWEAVANRATLETVADAEALERDGWPLPISGDYTTRFRHG